MEGWQFYQNGARQWCWKHLYSGEVLRKANARSQAALIALPTQCITATCRAPASPENGFALPWRTRRAYP
ncbi:MAG: hypothetical protein ACXW20_04045 [Burkholderiales bacterium]